MRRAVSSRLAQNGRARQRSGGADERRRVPSEALDDMDEGVRAAFVLCELAELPTEDAARDRGGYARGSPPARSPGAADASRAPRPALESLRSDLDDIEERVELLCAVAACSGAREPRRVSRGPRRRGPSVWESGAMITKPAILLAGELPAVRHDPFAFTQVQDLSPSPGPPYWIETWVGRPQRGLASRWRAPVHRHTRRFRRPAPQASWPLGSAVTPRPARR